MIARGAAALLEWYLPRRRRTIERVAKQGGAVQEATLLRLVRQARATVFGRAHDFEGIRTLADYQARVPVADYLAFRPWWARALGGECDLTWPGRPAYWVKTSGTTAGDKVLPITAEMFASHCRGGWDAMLMAIEQAGARSLLGGTLLFPGGSSALAPIGEGAWVGDLSGLMVRRLLPVLRSRYSPGRAVSAIPDWETRIETMATIVAGQDVRLLCGMPSWVLVLFERIVRARRANGQPVATLDEAWPNLRVFVHGGVMVEPRLIELPAGTFYRWMREGGRLGDQHKVPRVTNDRRVADALLDAAARSCPRSSPGQKWSPRTERLACRRPLSR